MMCETQYVLLTRETQSSLGVQTGSLVPNPSGSSIYTAWPKEPPKNDSTRPPSIAQGLVVHKDILIFYPAIHSKSLQITFKPRGKAKSIQIRLILHRIARKTTFLQFWIDNSVGKDRLECRRPPFNSWVGKIPWRRDRLPTPVYLGFLVAQLVKNPSTIWETWVRSLGWEDPLEKGKATNSSILA